MEVKTEGSGSASYLSVISGRPVRYSLLVRGSQYEIDGEFEFENGGSRYKVLVEFKSIASSKARRDARRQLLREMQYLQEDLRGYDALFFVSVLYDTFRSKEEGKFVFREFVEFEVYPGSSGGEAAR